MVSNSVGSGRTWLQNTLWLLHVSLFLLKLLFSSCLLASTKEETSPDHPETESVLCAKSEVSDTR